MNTFLLLFALCVLGSPVVIQDLPRSILGLVLNNIAMQEQETAALVSREWRSAYFDQNRHILDILHGQHPCPFHFMARQTSMRADQLRFIGQKYRKATGRKNPKICTQLTMQCESMIDYEDRTPWQLALDYDHDAFFKAAFDYWGCVFEMPTDIKTSLMTISETRPRLSEFYERTKNFNVALLNKDRYTIDEILSGSEVFSVSLRIDNESSLYLAFLFGSIDLLKRLDFDADIDVVSRLTIMATRIQVLKVVVERGGNLDMLFELSVSCKRSHFIEYLLKAGARLEGRYCWALKEVSLPTHLTLSSVLVRHWLNTCLWRSS